MLTFVRGHRSAASLPLRTDSPALRELKTELLLATDCLIMQDEFNTMKKLLCILATAALLGACEQKTEVAAPAASPVPEKKASDSAVDPNTFSKSRKPMLSSDQKSEPAESPSP